MTNSEYERVRERKQRERDSYYSDKSFGVALFLCLFFGWLGAHCFYLNKPFKGLLFLCTGGLGGLGWFYDLVTLKTQVEDVNYDNTSARRKGWDRVE